MRRGKSILTIEQLRTLYRSQPFQPFTIHLADGREIAVNHPEYLSFSPSGRTIVVHQLDDSFTIVDLLLVTDLEVGSGPGKLSQLHGS
jgi:hypothetical protein